MKTYINVVLCKQCVLKMFSLKALIRKHLRQILEEIMRQIETLYRQYHHYIKK